MERNQRLSAIILKQRVIGESHAGITLFCAEHGLLQAIAHGVHSLRGSLRGKIAVYSAGEFDLYHDPVKGSTKVVDVVIENQFPGIRENIERYYTASLWAEIILKTHGGGEAAAYVYSLLHEGLEMLDACRPESIRQLSIHILVRWLDGVGGISDRDIRELNPDAVPVLHTALVQDLAAAMRQAMPEPVQRHLLGWCYRKLQHETEGELNTLRTGKGIIV